MELVVAEMAYQRRLVLDLPITVFPFDETEMLGRTPQYGLSALLDFVTDLVGVDIRDGAGEIDARAPCGKRRQRRQLSEVPAIALGGGAGEKTALPVRSLGNPTGDREARSKPPHIPLEGGRQCLVEIVDIEYCGALRRRIGAEIGEMTIAAGLHAQTRRGARREIGSHDRRSTPQKGKGVHLHPRIAHRKQLRDAVLALLDQNLDRIAAALGRGPFGQRIKWHLTPPFRTLRAPLVEPRRHVSRIE